MCLRAGRMRAAAPRRLYRVYLIHEIIPADDRPHRAADHPGVNQINVVSARANERECGGWW